jgi:hypothetical protein
VGLGFFLPPILEVIEPENINFISSQMIIVEVKGVTYNLSMMLSFQQNTAHCI